MQVLVVDQLVAVSQHGKFNAKVGCAVLVLGGVRSTGFVFSTGKAPPY